MRRTKEERDKKDSRDHLQDVAIAKINERFDGFVKHIESRFENIGEKVDNVMDISKETLKQVKMTNGRVTRLELWKARLGGSWIAVVIMASVLGTAVGLAAAWLAHKT